MSNTNVYSLNNGTVLNTAQIIKAVMSSTAKAELGAFFLNAKQAAPMRQILLKMRHLQTPMPIQLDHPNGYNSNGHALSLAP